MTYVAGLMYPGLSLRVWDRSLMDEVRMFNAFYAVVLRSMEAQMVVWIRPDGHLPAAFAQAITNLRSGVLAS